MSLTLSNISIREINNNFSDTLSLTTAVSWTINNTTGETLSTDQDISVNAPVDFNNGVIPNTDAIEFVTEDDLVFRNDSNKDSRAILYLNDIKDDSHLRIRGNRPITLINLIKLSAQTKTTIDVVDSNGRILKTITDINDILYSENNIKYIIENIDNDFVDNELNNYLYLPNNQIPLKISDGEVSFLSEALLNYLLIVIADINLENIITLKRDGINKLFSITFGLRFNIDNTKPFPLQYPLVNTNFNSRQVYSDPIMFTTYVRTGTNDLLKMFEDDVLTKMYLYF